MDDEKRFKALKIYVTGYGAFGDIITNPTTVLVNKIKENLAQIYEIYNFEIISADILKVAWSEVEKFCEDLHQKLENEKDNEVMHLVIHFGVASSREHITVERIARNSTCGADVDGVEKKGHINHLCLQDYGCRLDINSIIESINSKGESFAAPSDDAGSYLCNYIYYCNESRCRGKNLDNVFCVFIHMPMHEFVNECLQYQYFIDFVNEVREKYIKD